ncbi:MAG: putative rane associated dehydrogenase (flavoprotein) [Rickettsiaceae bacterium]|jgi:flavin-dependent dehydrogenase|nr:putative rane associated dehydrogenase (flavoprotein) [Rickettsiaceae bacterium]
MKNYDVIIIGASFAGIACAKEVAAKGLSVAVLERKKDVKDNIHTTGIFVNEAADLVELPPYLYKEIRQVRLYSSAQQYIEVKSKDYLFLATDTPELMDYLVEDARKYGVDFFFGNALADVQESGDFVIVNDTFKGRFLIGADGAKSKVAELCNLGKNEKFLIGTEFEYEGIKVDNVDAFYCFLSQKYAPGYIGWLIPGPKVTQIGVAKIYNKKKQGRPDLEGFLEFIKNEMNAKDAQITEKRGGLIPIGGVVKPFYRNNVILVGDSAGIVSPLTAGGIHTALFYGKRLGELIYGYLKSNEVHPGIILEKEYPRFPHKHFYRFIFDRIPDWLFNLIIRVPGFSIVANMMFFLKKRLPKK